MAEEKKKYCPLKFAASKSKTAYVIGQHCDKESCAFWVPRERLCAVRQIAEDLNHIASHSKFQ